MGRGITSASGTAWMGCGNTTFPPNTHATPVLTHVSLTAAFDAADRGWQIINVVKPFQMAWRDVPQ